MIRKQRFFPQLVLMVMLLLNYNPLMANDSAAIALVENLHTVLLDNMQNSEQLGYKGRYQQIEPVINDSFDFPKIARVVLSRYWDKLDGEQKNGFIEHLRKLTVATYASRFSAYENEQFVTASIDELKKGRRLVKTKVIANDEEDAKLEYLVHEQEGKWMIISVIANGVNDLSLKRAEYSAVIKERGFDNLIAEISQKISEMEDS